MSGTEADILVVGGGGAGLSAAIEAAEAGARVLVLEKAPELKGSTGRSVGSIAASGTPDQRRLGIVDNPEEHLADYLKMAGENSHRDNPELARVLCENAAGSIAWLRWLGLEFFGPVQELPHRQPRLHNVLPNSMSYIYHLSRRARKLGIEVRVQFRARRLVTDGGRVTGVEATTADGSIHRFTARRAVVLAGGDYSASREFRALHSEEYAAVPPVNPYNTGDCQLMAREIGGVIVNVDFVRPPNFRFVLPAVPHWVSAIPPVRLFTVPMKWSLRHLPGWMIRPAVMSFVLTFLGPDKGLFRFGALLVNAEGRRFVGADAPGFAIARQPGNAAYLVFDATTANRFTAWPHYISTAPGVAFAYIDDYRRNRPDIFFNAPTLDQLAGKLGMPGAALQEAIAEHNKEIAARSSASGGTLRQQVDAPFYALGPVQSLIVGTEGGLRVSRRLEVLTADGQPIPGLYAAGAAGQGGLLLYGHGHKLGWAFTSGRIAGRNAAQPL